MRVIADTRTHEQATVPRIAQVYALYDTQSQDMTCTHRGADKSLARTTSQCLV